MLEYNTTLKYTKKEPFEALLKWSGRRGSNSRHLPWQGSILPLNYSRKIACKFIIHKEFYFSSILFLF